MRIPAPQRTDQGHEGARVDDSEVSKWTRCVRTKKPHLKLQLSRYSPIPKKELLDETLAVVYRAKYLADHRIRASQTAFPETSGPLNITTLYRYYSSSSPSPLSSTRINNPILMKHANITTYRERPSTLHHLCRRRQLLPFRHL